MMKNISLFMVVVLLTACATTESIYQSYKTMVDIADGVSEEEAKIIAKYNLTKMKERELYKISAPVIYTDSRATVYPKYWFVAFGPNWFAPMSKEREGLTYKELNSADYLVVIDKDNGDIVFSGLYFHTRVDDFDWIFDSNPKTLKSRFDLPPGRPGTKIDL